MSILKLIRWKNLLIIALVQILIKYVLFDVFTKLFGVQITLNWFGFSLLVLATLCLAAAGYVINDVYDVETDSINKPEKVIVGKTVSEKTANILFISLNLVGVLIGFYLSHLVGKSAFFALFVIISALLYVYATYLKQTIIIGNIVISILVALSLLIVGLFELLPVITPENQSVQTTMFKVLFDYAVFAFVINLVREMAKDIQDIDGDHKAGMNTLPIAIGRDRAKNVLFAASLIPIFAVVYYLVTYLYIHQIAVIYFLICVIAPLIYTSIKIFSAKTKTDYKHISNMLKLVMILGILSMLLYPIILK